MANKTRKVSFYRLTLEKHTLLPHSNVTEVKELNNQEIEEKFKELYDKQFITLANKNKAVKIEAPNNDYVIEVIEYKHKRAFIKIGQENDANTVALRNVITLESEDVPMGAEQLLELFTFCLIDFDTGIVSYIGINGAPKLSAIKCLFNNFFAETEKTYANLAAILTKDILELLSKKHTISKLTLTVAIPPDKVLQDIGVDLDPFYELGKFKTKTATYKLVAGRNRNIFESNEQFANFIDKIKQKFGKDVVGLSVNAKGTNENSQTYDLMQYNFTKTVSLNAENTNTLTVNDFKNALISTYNTNKNELILYSRN